MSGIELHVNGQSHHLEIDERTPLSTALRDGLGLMGVRSGCGMGACGSCTILVDDQAQRSCDVPVSTVVGREVTTPEGLGTPAQPHPVQEVFLEEQAAQCGYCINGMIMSTVAAHRRGEQPPVAPEVPTWLTEHLCRCGTHPRIANAVRRALALDPTGPADEVTTGSARDAADHPRATPVGWGADDLPAPDGSATPVDDDAANGVEIDPDQVHAWIRLAPTGRIQALTGKVELGQGIRTAFAQIVAAQLGVDAGRIDVLSTATGIAPDERYTAGSMSIENGGTALARAAVGFRRLLLRRAATLLGCREADLRIEDERIVAADGTAVDFQRIACDGTLEGPIEPDDVPDWSQLPLGSSRPRDDLRRKLTGAPAFLHDLTFPGMLHARTLLPPSPQAELESLDATGAREMDGIETVIVDGRIVIAVGGTQYAVTRAIERLRRDARWHVPDLETGPAELFDSMRALEPVRQVVADPTGQLPPTRVTVHASYTQPYQAHASIAPSCAIGHQDGDRLRIWSHTQGVYPLRGSLAELLALAPNDVQVIHADGPGCYGHNLADDAGAFAALAARAVPGTPVRFQFSVEDEFSWEPYGSAMLADLRAGVDDDGRIRHWSHHVLTDSHNVRPSGRADRLMVAWLREDELPLEWPGAGAGAGGARNATPIYDLEHVEAWADHVRGPLRTSALRTLGSYLNTFAAESFMDEVAEAASEDPLAFRLAHLSDERARDVLRRVAERAGWTPHVGPSGRGLGLAVSRYKDSKAYVAVAISLDVDSTTAAIRLRDVQVVCDAGVVVNPDGASNQIEGGVIQGLSRALHEEVAFDRHGVRSRDWTSYPVFGFADLPPIEVELVDRADQPPLGVGEASVGPAAAALANAVDDAVGLRMRQLPMTPERMLRRLHEMDEQEAERVLA